MPRVENGSGASSGGSLRSPVRPGRQVRAVLFDLDGTLYSQRPLRALMALELASLPARTPRAAWRSLRALSAFRRAQEHLRDQGREGQVSIRQLSFAAAASGLDTTATERVVEEWMFTRPLKYLPWLRARGLDRLLAFLRSAAVPAGVLSDYPADLKLRALGVAGQFSLVLSSSDPEIDAFKPSPRGFIHAARLWGLVPEEVLVVGDRHEVDAAGAIAAGMDCVIIGRRPSVETGPTVFVDSLEGLRRVLDNCR